MPDPKQDNPVTSVPTPTPVINQEEENRKQEEADLKAAKKRAKANKKRDNAEQEKAATNKETPESDKEKDDLKKSEPSKTGNNLADDFMEILLKVQEVARILEEEKNFGLLPLFKKAKNYFDKRDAKAEEKQWAKSNAKASSVSNAGKMTPPGNTPTPAVVNAANFNPLNRAKDVAQPASSPDLDNKPTSPQLN